MELPVYRMPSLKTVVLHLWEKTKDFVYRAFTIIFVGSLVIWFLTNLDWSFDMVAEQCAEYSRFDRHLRRSRIHPERFRDLAVGSRSRERIYRERGGDQHAGGCACRTVLSSFFTPLSALSFLVFTLLYTPCMAAVAATRREMGSLKWTLAAVAFQTGLAWAISAFVFQIGRVIAGA